MPTTNPVPSADPTDLLYNAQRLDEVVNSPNAEYATRLGEQRLTAKGATDSIRAFNSRGVWATATAYAVRDLVFVTPTWYACVTAHTSGATFVGDAANWRVHQGLTREELADDTSVLNGDWLVAVDNEDAGEVARTLHFWIKARKRNLCSFLLTAEVDDILSGTGATAVTAKFITAMQTVAGLGGSRGALLELPFGLINIGGAIAPGNVSRVWVEGQGAGTRVQTTHATADIFTLGDGTNECSGFQFSDFDVWSTVAKSAGYAFNGRFVTDSRWDNVNVGSLDLYTLAGSTHRLFRGWYFDRFGDCFINGGTSVTSGDGVQCRGNLDDSFSTELTIDGNIRFLFSAAAAVRIGGACGGVYLRRGDVSQCLNGVVIDKTLTALRNREIFIEGFNCDSCLGWGIHQVADSVALLVMRDPWAANCGATDGSSGGVLLEGGVSPGPFVTITGPMFYLNKGPGLRAEGGFVSVDAGQCVLNGNSVNGGHGVEFGGALPIRFSMSGTDCSNNGIAAKGYGVDIPVGLTNFNLNGVSVYGNLQGPINNAAGFSPTKIIRDCNGYVTANSGVQTSSSGTSVTVAHGLSATPGTVNLTPIGNPAFNGYNAGNFTSTTFDINFGGTLVDSRQFSWRAAVNGE